MSGGAICVDDDSARMWVMFAPTWQQHAEHTNHIAIHAQHKTALVSRLYIPVENDRAGLHTSALYRLQATSFHLKSLNCCSVAITLFK